MSRRTPSLAPHNHALVLHIQQHQPCTYAQISTHLQQQDNPACTPANQPLRKRLSYLKNQGWLLYERGLWCINPSPKAAPARPHPTPRPKAQPTEAPAEALPEASLAAIVRPREINVMHAPIYCPTPWQVRPGANQFLACRSHGARC